MKQYLNQFNIIASIANMIPTPRYKEVSLSEYMTAPIDTYYVDTVLVSELVERLMTREERKREFEENRFKPKYSSKPFKMSDHVKLQDDEYAIRFDVLNNSNIVEVRDSSNCHRDYRGTPAFKCDFAEFKSSVCTCSNLLYMKYDSGDFYYIIVTNYCNVYYVWLTSNKSHCVQEEPDVNVKMIVSTNIKMSEMLIDMTLISVNYKMMSDLVIRHYGERSTSSKHAQIIDLLQQSIDKYKKTIVEMEQKHSETLAKLTKTKYEVMEITKSKCELEKTYKMTRAEMTRVEEQLNTSLTISNAKTAEINKLHEKIRSVKNVLNDFVD